MSFLCRLCCHLCVVHVPASLQPCSARTTSTTWYMTVAIQATGQKDLLAVLGDKSSKEAIELPGVKVFIMGVKPAVQ